MQWRLKNLVKAICDRLQNRFDCFIVIEGSRGLGKCQKKGSKVLLSNGEWKNIEDIKIGDEIVSPQKDGNFTHEKVEEIHNRFDKNVYDIREVTRQKKVLYTCAGNHDVVCFSMLNRGIKNIEAKELTKIKRIFSFTTPAISYKQKDAEIDPYCLGVHIGDGYSSKYGIEWGFNNKKQPCIDYFVKKYPKDITSSKKRKNNQVRYHIKHKGEFSKQIHKLGIYLKKSGNKFIPKECLLSSINYRFELLAGLIDTDGTVHKNNIIYTTVSKRLSENIRDLVFSLGGRARIQKKRKFYNILIAFKNNKIIPLKVKHKKEGLNIKRTNPTHVAIESVKTKPQQVYGFSLSGNSKWYVTDNWMITHNSTLAFKLSKAVSKEMRRRGVKKDYKFLPHRDILYTRAEIIKFFNGRNKTGIGDEFVLAGFGRDFYSEEQKDLIKLINLNRDHNNLMFSCIPHFKVMDTQLKGLTSMRITVIRRGFAIIQTPNKTIYSPDIWDEALNSKIERKWVETKTKNPQYARLTTCRGFVKFTKLTDKDEALYQKVKDDKRQQIAKGKGWEEEEVVTPFDIIYNTLIENKIKNSTMFEGMVMAHGFEIERIRSKIYKRLKAESKQTGLSNYYFGKEDSMKKNLQDITKGL